MVQVLLEYGLDADSPDLNGNTVLIYASKDGHRNDNRVARLLIERGADPNTVGVLDYTPLHHASEYGRIEIARLLIEYGANVEAKENWGRTPLNLARDDEMKNLLLEHHVM